VKSDKRPVVLQQRAPVLKNREVAPDIYLMEVYSSELVALGRPGQFLHLRVRADNGPLLRRPLSLFSRDEPGATVGLLYRRVGAGTRILSALPPGAELDLVGPLGRGFSPPPGIERALLVAGGLGLAPLFFLAQEFIAQGVAVSFLLGAVCREQLLCTDRLRAMGVTLDVSTDDGSEGFQGLVTALLEDVIGRRTFEPQGCCLFVTGPEPMMIAVASLARRHGLPAQFSLERHMACGLGACWGCVVRCRDEHGRPVYRRVCADGPVFDLADLPWGLTP